MQSVNTQVDCGTFTGLDDFFFDLFFDFIYDFFDACRMNTSVRYQLV